VITTITGVNDFLRTTELEALVGQFIAEHGEMGLERLDGEEATYQQLYDAITGLSFLSPEKLLVLRSPSANKAFSEHAEQLLGDIPETTDIILVEPKLDKRTSYYKFLKAASDFREFGELDTNGLVTWAVAYAKTEQGSLSEARFLVERVGTNQQLLKNELDKLLLYNPELSRQNIERMTEATPQSTIFKLLEAAFAGNTTKALTLYAEQRALKVEPQQIVAMLAWQLHVLAVVKTAGERTPDEIAREAKINPFVVRKSGAIARTLTLAALKKLIQDALLLDIRLKSESIDADDALQLYLLSLSLSASGVAERYP
jgi:DNA polymerase-3 subunit delta